MSKAFVIKLILIFMLFHHSFAATNPKTLQFPFDHGKHADAEIEWWGFFGHLLDTEQHLFGFSLTFLRLSVPLQKPPSKWVTQDIYSSYFTITDGEQEQFYNQEKINRTSFNYAGASDKELLIWNRGWLAIMNSKSILIQAQTNKVALTLQVTPAKPPQLLGQNGFIESNDLYYYVLPNIQGHGELRIGNKKHQIVGVRGGVDHAFQGKRNDNTVWDKFVIQLNNGDDILLYIFASKNSILVYPESFCIINHSDGTSKMIKLADFQFTPLDSWYSPNSKVTYPSSWTLTIPEYHYDLVIKPTLNDQEVVTINTTFWGGQGVVTGKKDGVPLIGYAYVELSKQNSRGYIL